LNSTVDLEAPRMYAANETKDEKTKAFAQEDNNATENATKADANATLIEAKPLKS